MKYLYPAGGTLGEVWEPTVLEDRIYTSFFVHHK